MSLLAVMPLTVSLFESALLGPANSQPGSSILEPVPVVQPNNKPDDDDDLWAAIDDIGTSATDVPFTLESGDNYPLGMD